MARTPHLSHITNYLGYFSMSIWRHHTAGIHDILVSSCIVSLLAVAIPSPLVGQAPAPDAPAETAPPSSPPAVAEPEVAAKPSLSINKPEAYRGYTLLSPLRSKTTYLLDIESRVVKQWDTECFPGNCAYLLENGNLFRPGQLMGEEQSFGGGPGAGGRIQEFAWNGDVVWDFKFLNAKQLAHHDAIKLPNGNVLMIVWDKKTEEEAIAAGRKPETVRESYLLPDSLVEVKPTGKTSGEVVWEWHLWDHLIQDFDKTKANYGNVSEHPELVDLNYGRDVVGQFAKIAGGANNLQTIGYVGATTNRPAGRPNPDWTHFNGVAYNADLDQIIVSIHTFSEIWIIDHSTTTAEAASHSGGRSGKGGDLLYRWGNPEAYRAGLAADRRLFSQHNAHWIPAGFPGAGHLLIFNNSHESKEGNYSTVDEIILPLDSDGQYEREAGTAFGPAEAHWSYRAEKPTDFYSSFISGSQRLANGNTLICSGASGTVFEVTPDKQIVWQFLNPSSDEPGDGPGGPSVVGQIIPSFLHDPLKITNVQRNAIDALQHDVDEKLKSILSDEQQRLFADLRRNPPPTNGGPPGAGGPPPAGPNFGPPAAGRPNFGPPGAGQAPIPAAPRADQGNAAAPPPGAPGPGDRPTGGRPPGGGRGGPNGSSLFRAYRYAPDFPGLLGKELVPGRTLEELIAAQQQEQQAAEKKDPENRSTPPADVPKP